MNHTKEPWEYLGERAPQILGEDKVIALLYSDAMLLGKDKTLLSNAKRIVACVNACAGITNEALEAGVVEWGVNMANDITSGDIWKDGEKVKVWEDV